MTGDRIGVQLSHLAYYSAHILHVFDGTEGLRQTEMNKKYVSVLNFLQIFTL